MQEENNSNPSDIQCISVPAAGRILGVSRGTAYSMARSGQLKVIRCGARRLVVPLPALRRMLEGENENDGSRPHQNH